MEIIRGPFTFFLSTLDITMIFRGGSDVNNFAGDLKND